MKIKSLAVIIAVFAIGISGVQSARAARKARQERTRLVGEIRSEIMFEQWNFWCTVQLPNGGAPTYDEVDLRVRVKYAPLIRKNPEIGDIFPMLRKQHELGLWNSDRIQETIKSD